MTPPPPLEMENSQNGQMHCTFFPLDMICNVIYERFEKCIAILEFEMFNKLLGASTTKYYLTWNKSFFYRKWISPYNFVSVPVISFHNYLQKFLLLFRVLRAGDCDEDEEEEGSAGAGRLERLRRQQVQQARQQPSSKEEVQ